MSKTFFLVWLVIEIVSDRNSDANAVANGIFLCRKQKRELLHIVSYKIVNCDELLHIAASWCHHLSTLDWWWQNFAFAKPLRYDRAFHEMQCNA